MTWSENFFSLESFFSSRFFDGLKRENVQNLENIFEMLGLQLGSDVLYLC